jgi:hypothetical protein
LPIRSAVESTVRVDTVFIDRERRAALSNNSHWARMVYRAVLENNTIPQYTPSHCTVVVPTRVLLILSFDYVQKGLDESTSLTCTCTIIPVTTNG